jgi:hypothetical protein
MRSHLIACFSALCRTWWIFWTVAGERSWSSFSRYRRCRCIAFRFFSFTRPSVGLTWLVTRYLSRE